MPITIHHSNNCYFVWKLEDVQQLRQKYRIVGNNVGAAHSHSNQVLPLALMFEEVLLLLSRNICHVVDLQEVFVKEDPEAKVKYERTLEENFLEQKLAYQRERENEVMQNADKIIAGKRKKIETRRMKERAKRLKTDHAEDMVQSMSPDELMEISDRDILQQTIERYPQLKKDSMLIEIPFEHELQPQDEIVELMHLPPPEDLRPKTKWKTFEDLWNKKYYLTSGEKFGGDFLAYPGDPCKYHSQFIILCLPKLNATTCSLSGREIIQHGRLGTNVKKTVILAYLSNENVVYQSLSWTGIK